MLFHSSPAHTNTVNLGVVVDRLAAQRVVDGILLMGSTGTGELTPTSDYDLLLLLDVVTVPLSMVTTWVDGRLTEIYCIGVVGLDAVLDGADDWADGSAEGVVVRWLQSGRIVHDRSGRLERAQLVARGVQTQVVATPRDLYNNWRKIGYNVAQIKRYLASEDPLEREAVDWRLLYSLDEVKYAYFAARLIPWRGEKPALKYLVAHDLAFLDLFRRCLSETDRDRKVALYEEAARLALAPIGDLWAIGTTCVAPGPGYGVAPEAGAEYPVEAARAFWDDLIRE